MHHAALSLCLRAQLQLAEKIAATGKPVVMLLSSGRPLDLSQMEPLANAIIEVWQPGTAGGAAAADILSGDVNPSGKLAMTFPRSTGQIPIYSQPTRLCTPPSGFLPGYPVDPVVSFWPWTQLYDIRIWRASVSSSTFRKGRKTVTVPVTNTGSRAGAEAAAMVYIRSGSINHTSANGVEAF